MTLRNALVFLAVACWLCPVPAAAQGNVPTVTVALSRDPSTMDPQAHGEGFTDQIHIHIHDGLLSQSSTNPDPKTRIQPQLATAYRLVNPTTWRFTLRPNVKFHDGGPFTAEDVKFTFDRLLDPTAKLPAAVSFPTLKEVRVVDPLTVDIVTKAPDPILLVRMSTYGNLILSKHHYDKVGAQTFAREPVGTGPYRFVRRVKDQEVVLEAFKDYWGGERQIKRLVYKTIPDMATRVAAIQTGAVDIVGEGGIPPAFISQLEKDPNVRLSYAKGGSTNLHIGLETRKGGPLADRRVRLALAHAIDVEAIVKNVLEGRARPTAAVVTPYTVGYDPTVKPVPHNPELAKKLLAEAGAAGTELVFNSSGGRYANEREVVEALAAQMQAAGAKVRVNYLEWGAYMAKRRENTTGQDMMLLGWSTGGKMDADTQLFAVLKCGAPFANFCDDALDRLLVGTTAEMDPPARNRLWSQVQQYIVTNAPIIPLYAVDAVFAIHKRVENFEAAWDYRILLHEARVKP